MIRVSVAGMSLDERTGSPVVLLLVPPEEKCLPIWIGSAEGTSIAMALHEKKFARPLTHDLLETILHTYGVRVIKLEIGEIQQTTFIGRLSLEDSVGQIVQIDARPSDGTALALGAGAPIYVSAKVLDQIGEPAAAWQLAPR